MKITRLGLNKEALIKAVEQQYSKIGVSDTGVLSLNLSEYTAIKPEEAPEIEVIFHPDAYVKMFQIVMANDKEVAWHGFVQKFENQYVVMDIKAYPQEITAATVNADEIEYPKWIMENAENLPNMRMQGHSHVNMTVFASGTDLQYYQDLYRQVNDYYIFLIMNKKGEIHIRFYDKLNQLLYTDLPVLILGRTAKKEKLPLERYNLGSWYEGQQKMFKTKVFTTALPSTPAYSGRRSPNTQQEADNYADYWDNVYKRLGTPE